jgi:hypothetical protein
MEKQVTQIRRICNNSESNPDFLCGISRKQSPSCQCLWIHFYRTATTITITSHFSGTIRGWVLADRGKPWPTCHSGKNFYVGVLKKFMYDGPESSPVGSGSNWTDQDPWKNYGRSQSIGLRVVAKSAGSENSCFTSMDALLYGP